MQKTAVLIFSFVALSAHAQQNYMSLSFGASCPLGDFADNRYISENGFAGNGYSGEYTGAYFLKDNLALGGNIKYTSNPLDVVALGNLLEQEAPDSLFPNAPETFRTGLWKQITFLAGPHASLALAPEFTADIYALTGINFVLAPEYEFMVTEEETWYSKSLTTRNVSYAMELGLALRYNLNDDYGLRFYGSYFLSQVKGSLHEVIKTSGTDDLLTTETAFSTTIQSLFAGMGLVYRL
jgi:hypothetical protein